MFITNINKDGLLTKRHGNRSAKDISDLVDVVNITLINTAVSQLQALRKENEIDGTSANSRKQKILKRALNAKILDI